MLGTNERQKDDSGGEPAFDVIVVGAGFAGLYLLYRLRQLGLSVVALEAGKDVGGTWYWNRYPGARCDVPSLQYSYSFSAELQREWRWTEKYAGQPEILEYLRHVADRFALRDHIRFETRVSGASFADAQNIWSVETDAGEVLQARHLILATGSLSTARLPPIDGIDKFQGRILHTGLWPHEDVDFTGRRVGVIGTGSSGVQLIPVVAEQADTVVVFQRTANFTIPARNGPLDDATTDAWKASYEERRRAARETRSAVLYDYNEKSAVATPPHEREREFERRWSSGGTNFLYAYNDLLRDEASNNLAADFVRAKIDAVVADPATAAALKPVGFPIGAKRICIGTDYYETFNRPNVRLVDLLATPIQRVTAREVITAEGGIPIDDLILATGFDAMTGALLAMDLRGAGGASLRDKWRAGPRTYLGLMTSGFPNMFIVNGPGSPSVFTNMVVSIEQNTDWIVECIAKLGDMGHARIEATLSAEDAWVDHVNEVAQQTLYHKAASWYLGANIPGKPRVFMPYVGGFAAYAAKCADVARKGYQGFRTGHRAIAEIVS